MSPLPLLSVAETLGWCQSEGNVDHLTSHANFTIDGVNHLYGSPAKRIGKSPSLGQRAAQDKKIGKVERMYVRLKQGDVTFDQKSALKLAGLDTDDDSPPPATRLIASAFDIEKIVARSKLCDIFQKSTRKPCSKRALGSHTQWSCRFVCEWSPQIPPREQLHARKVDLRCRVCGGGAIFSVGKKDYDKLREIGDGSRVSLVPL